MVWWHWWLLTSPDKLSGFSFTPFDKMVQSLVLDHARGFLNAVDTLWLAPIYFLAGAGCVTWCG